MVSLPGSNEILTLSGVVPIHDALGTTLATVNSAGALATQYTYDPFGNVTPGSSGYGTTFGMGGIELDPTGLYHTGTRYYNPTLQRFLSEDPKDYAGGDANLFAYSGNDTVGASDPSGLDGCPNGDCGSGVGGYSDMSSLGGVLSFTWNLLQTIFGNTPSTTAPVAFFGNLQAQHSFLVTKFTAGILASRGTNVFGPNDGILRAALRFNGLDRVDPSGSDDFFWSITPMPEMAYGEQFGERALQSRAAHNAEQRTVREIAKELGLGEKDWDRLHDAIGWAQEEGKLGFQELLKEVRRYFPEKK